MTGASYSKKIIPRVALLSILITIFAVAPFLHNTFTIAQESEESTESPALTIAPSIIEMNVQGDNSYSQEIVVSSGSDFPIPVKIEVTDYAIDESGAPDYSDDLTGWSPKDWISVDSPDLILSPNESRTITLGIDIPQKALPGSHFASIIFKPVLPPEHFEPHSAHIIPYIGAIIALDVDGEEKLSREYLSIQSFEANLEDEDTEATFAGELHNDDVYYHRVDGTVHIYNMFDKEVKSIEAGRVTLMPESSNDIRGSLTEDLSFGRYRSELIVEGDNDSATESTTFWVSPDIIEIIIGVVSLCGLIVAGTLIYFLLFRRERLTKAASIILKKRTKKKS